MSHGKQEAEHPLEHLVGEVGTKEVGSNFFLKHLSLSNKILPGMNNNNNNPEAHGEASVGI